MRRSILAALVAVLLIAAPVIAGAAPSPPLLVQEYRSENPLHAHPSPCYPQDGHPLLQRLPGRELRRSCPTGWDLDGRDDWDAGLLLGHGAQRDRPVVGLRWRDRGPDALLRWLSRRFPMPTRPAGCRRPMLRAGRSRTRRTSLLATFSSSSSVMMVRQQRP